MSEGFETGSDLKRSVFEASQKIEGIIDAAEAAAAGIRADARIAAEREAAAIRAEAQRSVEGSTSQIAEAVAAVSVRIDNLRVEVAALSHELDTAAGRIRDMADPAADPASPTSASTASSVAPAAAPAAPEVPEAAPMEVPEAAPAAPEPDLPPDVLPEPGSVLDPGPAPIAYPGIGAAAGDVPEAPTAPDDEEVVLRATQMAVSGSSRAEIQAALTKEFDLPDAEPLLDEILGESA